MLSWRVGAVKISRVLELEMATPYAAETPFIAEATPEALLAMPWLRPHFVTEEGAVNMSSHALLVEAPGLILVVDTCVGNDKVRAFLNGGVLSLPFLERFAESGVRREDVDVVVCTHLHMDHVGWNTMKGADGAWTPTFPNARYLISAAEYEAAHAEPNADAQAMLADSIKPVFERGMVDLVAMDHRISDEVRLIPTPGHTPGHVSVEIVSEGAWALITGDLIHHPCQVAHHDWSTRFDSDRAVAVATRRAFVCAAADQPVLVIGTHFPAPTAGYVVREGEGFWFRV